MVVVSRGYRQAATRENVTRGEWVLGGNKEEE